MYNNILVPIVFDHNLDNSTGLQVAARVGAQDAKTTLLHVIEKLPNYVLPYIPEDTANARRVELLTEMENLLRDFSNAEGKIVTGHPGRTILDYANENAVDLIIVKSHRPGFEDYFLGSTANYIVRHAKCAVHVIR